LATVNTSRGPGQRAGLTRTRVLDAASDLLAERGAAALTMRAVAERLGVAPNTIYSHVADKSELVDGVLDRVLAQVEAPAPGAGVDPVTALHRLMSSTHEVLLRHPDLVPVYLARQGAEGENARHLGDVVLAHLAAAGVTGPAAREALRVLIVYTIGFAAFATPAGPGDAGPLAADELEGNFDRGLRWLLAGIAAERTTITGTDG
jgi:TetR/AcrR family tetracycline transcriptional repressor